jgi:hypothetical protein
MCKEWGKETIMYMLYGDIYITINCNEGFMFCGYKWEINYFFYKIADCWM